MKIWIKNSRKREVIYNSGSCGKQELPLTQVAAGIMEESPWKISKLLAKDNIAYDISEHRKLRSARLL